ncbi:Uncharacterized protein KF715C_pB3150 (plasmid) [Pseudomonas putida]|jgi:hypothetical protein|uniref:Uncharacterized protein n=1 Tax=Pseudomonas putida TaxID=303 RepID=A0A1L7NPP3_PSEPU|nr:Uncharacterized protein KF715C_pB3150 [Pseudomonas putida]
MAEEISGRPESPAAWLLKYAAAEVFTELSAAQVTLASARGSANKAGSRFDKAMF